MGIQPKLVRCTKDLRLMLGDLTSILSDGLHERKSPSWSRSIVCLGETNNLGGVGSENF